MTDTEERLIAARCTSDLKMNGVNCDAAVLVAAALAAAEHPRGSVFMDLKSEFDEMHANVKRDDRENIERDVANAKRKAADGAERLDAEGLAARADALGRHIAYIRSTYETSAKRAAMFGLPSMSAAMDHAEAMVHARAFRLDSPVPVGDMRQVTWQAVSLFLDETCYHCDGRGFNGGYDGRPQLDCKHCIRYIRGKRHGFVGKSEAERVLINDVSMQIDEERGRFVSRVAQIRREMRAA
jgi:hypothetical protein